MGGEITIIDNIMRRCDIRNWGVSSFKDIENSLISCSGIKRLPEKAEPVICAVFPYYVKSEGGVISEYAMAQDYHIVAGNMLRKAADSLLEKYPEYKFVPFCDASPIPEVRAAQLAGLGAIGENGLLITREYGSFVFIGEIVTDMKIDICDKPGEFCAKCGLCSSKCPAGAISGGKIQKDRCVSHLTQKKGTLTQEEKKLIKCADTIWGCDICQNVCPMNTNINETYIEIFKKDLISTLSLKDIEDENFEKKYASRAFLWRGKKVLKRNISILKETPENNNFVQRSDKNEGSGNNDHSHCKH